MLVVDAIGKRYGRLTVIARAGSNKKKNAVWLCICDCGNYTKVAGNKLRSGHTQSCGCLFKEQQSKGRAIHNGNHEALYSVWKGIRQRCNDPNFPAYKNYGARGIAMCTEWNDYAAFRAWAYQAGYSPGLDIDRINNNSNYSPENCRWVSRKKNCNNTRRNVLITYDGRTQTATMWAEELGLSPCTVLWRYHHWENVEDVLFTPLRGA